MFDLKQYFIRRSRRRTIGLQVNCLGEIVVRCPYGTPEEEIRRFIGEKSGWIEKEREKWRKTPASTVSLDKNGRVPFLGVLLPLRYHDERSVRLSGFDLDPVSYDKPSEYPYLENAAIYLPSPAFRKRGVSLVSESMSLGEERRQNMELLARWYTERAKELLGARTRFYAEMMGMEPPAVRIGSTYSQLGSYHIYKYLIRYTWFLMTVGVYEIDSVVVHELSHVRQHHHDKAFYAEMERYLPDRKAREAALKRAEWAIFLMGNGYKQSR